MAYKGEISVGDIALYQTYFATIVNQVSNLITLLPTISKGTECITSVGEVLLAHDVEENESKEKVEKVEGSFRFEDVSFAYDEKKTVLSGFDISVQPGETVAFVGESGAGKTTLINMAIGFLKPDSGRVLLDGKDMKELNLRSYRRFLAVVPQNTILFSGTIRDNIAMGKPDATDEEIIAAAKATHAHSFIRRLPKGYDTVITEDGGSLSQGEKQLLCITRVMLCLPPMLILDEATSALDSESEELVQNALDNLMENRTSIVIAHRLSTIINVDKIIVMDKGEIVEMGTHEDLLAGNGRYTELYHMQFKDVLA